MELPGTKALKALADENRIRAVLALRGRELCVRQIVELLGLAPSTVSKHLQVLKNAGLVKSRKKGRWVYYTLHSDNPVSTLEVALEQVLVAMAETPRARLDSARLDEILRLDSDTLCLEHESC